MDPFHMVPQGILFGTLKYFASAEFHSFATNRNLIFMINTFTEAPGHRLHDHKHRKSSQHNYKCPRVTLKPYLLSRPLI